MSKLREVNRPIEDAVVGSYRKIEKKVVDSYRQIEDRFIDAFLAQDGESTQQARARVVRQREERQCQQDRRAGRRER